MTRRHWHDLPQTVRRQVVHRTGRVVRVEPVVTGAVSDLVAVLHTDHGMTFCKGVQDGNPLAWMHRNEARISPHLTGIAATLRWQVGCDGWLLLGFDHVPGRHPDLTPGSRDLSTVAATLTRLAAALTPGPPVPVPTASARWADHLDGDLVTGDTFAHTDVTPRNFLIDGDRTVVVDWSAPCRGAAWIDTALMVIRLVRAGHTPAAAEAWAATVGVWRRAPASSLDSFAEARAAWAGERHRRSPAPHRAELAAAAHAWVQHRRGAEARQLPSGGKGCSEHPLTVSETQRIGTAAPS